MRSTTVEMAPKTLSRLLISTLLLLSRPIIPFTSLWLILASFQTGGALSTFRTGSQGELTPLETHYFTIAKPGPVPGRQAASHAHQVVLDPTGKYLLVPDLGADLVRVFSIDLDNTVKAQDPLKMKPGTGPRHAVFWSPHHLANETSPIYLYVVAELGATLTGFQVTYNKAGLSFKQIHESGTTGNKPTPPGTAPAEIGVSVSSSPLFRPPPFLPLFFTFKISRVSSSSARCMSGRKAFD